MIYCFGFANSLNIGLRVYVKTFTSLPIWVAESVAGLPIADEHSDKFVS